MVQRSSSKFIYKKKISAVAEIMGNNHGFKCVNLVWVIFVCELELMSGQLVVLVYFIDATLQLNMYCTKYTENLKLHAFGL